MNVNQKIENALSSIVDGNIWPLSCPLESKPDKWITYLPELETPSLNGDDIDLEWTHYMQVHWFTKGQVNYMSVRKNIRKLLRDAGFSVTDIDYYYEHDGTVASPSGMGITHLVFSCNIEEDDADG